MPRFWRAGVVTVVIFAVRQVKMGRIAAALPLTTSKMPLRELPPAPSEDTGA